jgi:hypothetical protein
MSLRSLTCFGYQGSASRVYYLDSGGSVNELCWVQTSPGVWGFANNNLHAQAAAESALTSFSLEDGGIRVYFLDAENYVNELVYQNGGWSYHSLGYQAAAGSDLTSYANGGTNPRVYYQDANNYVNELAFDSVNGWGCTQLYQAAPGSSLTCYGISGVYTRLYYLDNNSLVHETAWISNKWVDTNLQSTAASGSALACLGLSGSSCVFYLDSNNYVHELGWSGRAGWTDTNLGSVSAAGSALACWVQSEALGSQAPHGYYLDSDSNVNEFYWTMGGPNNNPPAGWYQDSTGQVGTASTPLACFGVNSKFSRIYYFDVNFSVNEVGWNDGNWENTNLNQTAEAPPG